jgi:cytochrome P450
MRREGPLAFYMRMWRDYGDVFEHRLGRESITTFVHPDHIERLFRTNRDNYDKGTIVDVRAERVLGQSLFISRGETWEDLRFLMDPPFDKEEVKEFTWTMTAAIEALDARWEQIAKSGETVDLVDEMMRFAFSMISLSVFSEDLSAEGAESRQAIVFLLKYVQQLVLQPVFYPAWVPTPANRRFHESMAEITALVQKHIVARRSGGGSKPDLISHFLTATDPKGCPMSDVQVRDQVLTTFVAGQENAALALAWFWYMMSQHPEPEERMLEELKGLPSGPATLDAANGLSFTRRAFEETIRLYPIVWIMPRVALEDDVVGGYRVPAGSTVVVNSYLTHRHPAFWDNANTFDPDRLLPERVKGLPPYAYLPFGGGKRKCLGNKFAMNATMLFVAAMGRKYVIRPVPGHPVEPIAVSTIRPKYKMPATVRFRQ